MWGWRGSNETGGKTALACWESIALNGRRVYICFDSDVTTKAEVKLALTRLKAFLESQKAKVTIICLPPGEGGAKTGLDDYFAAGHTIAEMLALAWAPTPSEAHEPDVDESVFTDPATKPVIRSIRKRNVRH